MILFISPLVPETSLLATLCEQRSWPCLTCDTISGFIKAAEKTSPRVVVVRHRLGDGYSDDVFAWLKNSGRFPETRIVVLAPANCTVRQEARQVALGADCVLRDPLRLEVLLEYLARYRVEKTPALSTPARLEYPFAGAEVLPQECRLVRSGATVPVTPKVIELLRLLYDSTDKVIPYPILYFELFNRKFTGDTANCRVLLAKAVAAFQSIGIDLRTHVKVIPKSGYLYSPSGPDDGASASNAPTSPK